MTKKVMKEVGNGILQCKVCGQIGYPSLQSGTERKDGVTRYYRGSWQCPNGCKLPEKPKNQ